MIHIENTTIEEQIAYEKDFAKFNLEQAEKWKNKDLDEYGYHMKTYRESINKYRWLEELKAHREAWDGMKEGLLEMSHMSEYVSIKHMIQLIDEIRPKESDAE